MRKVLILLFLVVGLNGCHRSQVLASPKRVQMSSAEYDVLSEWIENKIAAKGADNHIDQIVIYSTTDSDDNLVRRDDNGQLVPWQKAAASLREKASSLQQTTLDAYQKANSVQGFIHPSLHTSLRYQIVDAPQLDSFFNRGGGSWPAYYKQFPGSQGILRFSRVGFNMDGTQALFYYSNSCGDLCGSGSYVVMQRHANHWVVEKEIVMWVS